MKSVFNWNDLRKSFEGKRVFVTGHSGFKGGWLSVILHQLGAELYGYSLPPNTQLSFYETVNISALYHKEWFADLRDQNELFAALQSTSPHIILHLAAQAIVRESYASPIETLMTNVIGTAHVLESARSLSELAAILVVTTDKCYENQEWAWGYREIDPLGGHDLYSSSKACAELVTSSYQRSFFRQSRVRIATARAGNVIGGGDWAKDRLVPDIIRGLRGDGVELRSPHAVRPWQHVLEPLSGYLSLTAALLSSEGASYQGAWNFGPDDQDVRTVLELTRILADAVGSSKWSIMENPIEPHEATLLKLDSSKAKSKLKWSPRLHIDACARMTAQWYLTWESNPGKVADLTRLQVHEFFNEY